MLVQDGTKNIKEASTQTDSKLARHEVLTQSKYVRFN